MVVVSRRSSEKGVVGGGEVGASFAGRGVAWWMVVVLWTDGEV
jgi:hypothetical protein